jgi:GT2 family glycosyltransferase
MGAKPLVSVVVPVFDGEPFLRESLESILAQTYPALEVIVMDDASTDASAAIAAEVAATDERVRVHAQPANVGQFANVNAGLERARGELVAVYHADDVYEPEIVEREVAFLREHPDAGAVFTLATYIDPAGNEFGRLNRLPPSLGSLELFDYRVVLDAVLRDSSGFLPTPSALVRHDVYSEVGSYATCYGIRGDVDMWLRIASRHPVGLIREHLFRYRVGAHNESRRFARARSELDPTFAVIDGRLADGDLRLAEPGALDAYESSRAADLLVAAGNAYALGRQDELRALLRRVRPARLARRRMQRWRLLVLYVALQLLARLPHSRAVGRLLRRRWHTPPRAER